MTDIKRLLGISFVVAACAGRTAHAPALPRALGTRADNVTIAMRMPGCYALEDGPWRSDRSLAAFYSPAAIPRRFRFDTVRIVGWDAMQDSMFPMLRVVTDIAGPFNYWQLRNRATSEIYVGPPLPLGGASLRLRPVLEGWAGDLTTFTDAIPANGVASATAPVLLRTTPCDTP